jgi:hypothetical protein
MYMCTCHIHFQNHIYSYHTYILTYLHAQMHEYVRKQQIDTYMHTYIYTRTYTYTRTWCMHDQRANYTRIGSFVFDTEDISEKDLHRILLRSHVHLYVRMHGYTYVCVEDISGKDLHRMLLRSHVYLYVCMHACMCIRMHV